MPLVLCAHLPLIDSLDSMNLIYLTDSLQEDVSTCLHNMPPHIDVPVKFNQGLQNLQMNVAITYKENGVLSNVNSLLFTMTHYNCLEMKMRQPWDDGIVEKWTQYVDSIARKCGSKNDWQSQQTITHNFLCVVRMAKFCCRIFLQHRKSWKFF